MIPIRSRITLAAFAVALVFLASISGMPGQDTKEPAKGPVSRARPIPSVDFHIPWMGMKIYGMHAESNKPVLGRPTAQASDLRYFYLPLMAFQKKGTGELDVSVSDDGDILLPLIYDSEAARQTVRDYLVKEKLIPADSVAGQVMTVAAKMWYLETAPGYEPHVRFGPYENFHFPMKGQLFTRLSPDQGRKFATDLKAGKVELQATIVFEGYTYKENTVVVYADDILSSNQYKKLTGPGGKGFVGRHQVARIGREACLTRGVAVTTEYHDPDFNDLVKSLIANHAQKETKAVADWNAVEAFFKEAGWDPNDLKADLIEASKYNENKEAREKFNSDINTSFEHKGQVGWSALSIAGSWNYQSNEKIARDVFSKWGLQTEFAGKKFIAKSIDVYSLNEAKIRQSSAFEVGKRKKTVSDGILTIAVNPKDNALHTMATPVYEERLANLARNFKELQEEFAKMGTSRHGLSGVWKCRGMDCSIIEFGDKLYLVNEVGRFAFADYDPKTRTSTVRSGQWGIGHQFTVNEDGTILKDKHGSEWHRPK